jgi:hypothetical protein
MDVCSAAKLKRITILVLLVLVSFSPVFPSSAAIYENTYQLLDHVGGSVLYDYYKSKDHTIIMYTEFAKFVTPDALSPIADDLWSIYQDEEAFANGVLMIVHQIPYNQSGPQKYPIETMVENEGDCDLFSFIAASIMKAGGLDVILLYYENETHMNLGVHLSEAPKEARFEVYYLNYSGNPYYIAETTGDTPNWESQWRVGECPEEFKGLSPRIITLENSEPSSPEQASSSFSELFDSSITFELSSKFTIEGSTIMVSGTVTPTYSSRNVTIYFSLDGSSWYPLQSLTINSNGHYAYYWNIQLIGRIYLRASWAGYEDYAGADSSIYSLLVLPKYLLFFIITAIILAVVWVVIKTVGHGHTEEAPQLGTYSNIEPTEFE